MKLTVLDDHEVSLNWIPGESHNSPISGSQRRHTHTHTHVGQVGTGSAQFGTVCGRLHKEATRLQEYQESPDE